MKNIYYLLLAVVLFGCTQDPAKEATKPATDPRPQNQLALIKELDVLDSIYKAQINDITKQEAIDTGKVKISNFILNKLNARAENWEATVLSIDDDGGGGKIQLIFPKGMEFDEQLPDRYAIVLEHSFLPENIKDKVKLLTKDDKVLVTGNFGKNVIDEIAIDSYHFSDESPFETPLFIFNIEDIKKIEPKTEK